MNAWVYGVRNVLVAFACPKSTSEGLPVDRVPCIPGIPGIQFTVVDRLCRIKKLEGSTQKLNIIAYSDSPSREPDAPPV